MGNQHGGQAGGGGGGAAAGAAVASPTVVTNGVALPASPEKASSPAAELAAKTSSAATSSSPTAAAASTTEPPTPPAHAAAISISATVTSSPSSPVSRRPPSTSFPVGEKFYGLENTCNVCYCNSVLQALYACRPFRQHVLQYYEEGRQRKKESESLLAALSQLFYRIQTSKKSRGVASPAVFVKRLKKANEQFDSYSHQDAQEFLIFLLNDLSDTIKAEQADRQHQLQQQQDPAPPPPARKSGGLSSLFASHSFASATHPAAPAAVLDSTAAPMLRDMSQISAAKALGTRTDQPTHDSTQQSTDASSTSAASSASSASFVDASTSSSSSLPPAVSSPPGAAANGGACAAASAPPTVSWVQALFEGTLTNVTECIRCGSVTHRDESFLDLSVDLSEHRSLSSCLRSFSHDELLHGADKYLCESCGCRQEALKSLRVKRLPAVLLLHMKRFKYNEQLRGFSKLTHRIAFPLTLRLDSISGTMQPSEPPPQQHQQHEQQQALYVLTAVVVHIGNSARSGHYVCMCRGSNGQFYLYDDTTITAINEDDVRATFGTEMGGSHQDGYLLLYQADSDVTTADSPLQLQTIRQQQRHTQHKEATTDVNGVHTNGTFGRVAVTAAH